MLIFSIAVFFILQVGSGLLYKYGALHQEYWLAGFIGGNILGISSIYFLMQVYKYINPNVAEAICRGGFFVLIQLAFVLFFHSRLNLVQWSGICLIVAGIMIVSFCNTSIKI